MKAHFILLAAGYAASAPVPQALADSFQVTVAATNLELVANGFADSEIQYALPDVAPGTEILVWQGYWNPNNYDAIFGWDDPNYVLKAGEAFFIHNLDDSSAHTYTVQGTPLSGPDFTHSMPTAGVGTPWAAHSAYDSIPPRRVQPNRVRGPGPMTRTASGMLGIRATCS